jgi:hypothetical protein
MTSQNIELSSWDTLYSAGIIDYTRIVLLGAVYSEIVTSPLNKPQIDKQTINKQRWYY